MSEPVRIGDAELWLGDCLEILPTLGKVDAVVTDPPYEAVMQNSFGKVSIARQGLGDIKKLQSVSRRGNLRFQPIDDIRTEAAKCIVGSCRGWAITFCMAEGVRAWRDEFEAAGARYKRAMVWIKPDAMPQFNGQGPSIGHEMMTAVWCGKGHSRWNGGGRPGNFTFNKNDGIRQHDTQKPLPLITELVNLFSFANQTVLDPFMGSGTTGVACAKLGRKFIGIEIEPKYFDIACERIQKAYDQPDFFIQPPKPAKQEALR